MAVVKQHSGVFPCYKIGGCYEKASQHVGTLKTVYNNIQTQLCTVSLSLTLFHSVRLSREATKYGQVPYLVVYSFWLVVVGLPTTLLELSMGQLSQQDPVGVWRAVPILRGLGHLKLLTSYLCCIYYMIFVALSSSYLIWIGKGSFPLKDCIKLQMTPNGYENKMNATQCFNTTFLTPFTENPQYLGIMAILIFMFWFFVPICLFRLRKSLKVAFSILAPITVVTAIVLCSFLSEKARLASFVESCKQWLVYEPQIWLSALVQVLLSTQIISGYLISAGGTIYRQSDVRWTSFVIISTNFSASWLWVLMWESIGGSDSQDTSFISILVIIYQSSVMERRAKEWPLIAFGIIILSGVITILTLLYPIFEKLQRLAGDHWRLFATATSALGTALSVVVLSRGMGLPTVLDEQVLPVLTIFTTAVEVVGFVFIYGCCYLAVDIEFLTGIKLPLMWILSWCVTPFLLLGIAGWWLKTLIDHNWSAGDEMWPLMGVFIGILVIMVVMAAVAVAKEEQFNLCSKLFATFRPSGNWGPQEPMARYVWMSQRNTEKIPANGNLVMSPVNYSDMIIKHYNEHCYHDNYREQFYDKNIEYYKNSDSIHKNDNSIENIATIYSTHSLPRKKKISTEEKFRSPNICIADGGINSSVNCNCNRHFTLNIPILGAGEISTSL